MMPTKIFRDRTPIAYISILFRGQETIQRKTFSVNHPSCYNVDMKQYEVKPYKKGGWVIVATETGREIIVFNDQGEVEKACRMLNEQEE